MPVLEFLIAEYLSHNLTVHCVSVWFTFSLLLLFFFFCFLLFIFIILIFPSQEHTQRKDLWTLVFYISLCLSYCFMWALILLLLLYCYSHAFRETNSLRRTMQIVECSLLHRRAQGRVSSKPRTPTSICENLLYPMCTCLNPPPQIP